MSTLRIAVVGGGISGISCAYFLKKRLKTLPVSHQITVYEKSPRIGGAIFSEIVDECLFEGGVDAFLSEDIEILKLCKDVSLEGDILNSDETRRETWVYVDGQLRKMPKGLMMSTPTRFWPFLKDTLISWPGKFRMAMDLFIPPQKGLFDESFANFIRRRLGKEAFEKIAEPLVSSITGSDVENMSIQSTFPLYPELEKTYGSLIKGLYQRRKKFLKAFPRSGSPKRSFFLSFKNGMTQLVDRLSDMIGREAFACSGIRAIQKQREKPGHHPYRLIQENGKAEDVDCVILATPSHVSAEITAPLDRTLSRALMAIPHRSAVIVNYAFKTNELRTSLPGFGFVVPQKEKRTIKAGSWTSLKFPNRCNQRTTVVRASISGDQVEACLAAEDGRIDARVRRDLRVIVGIDAKPLLHRVYRWPKSRPQYTLGHADRVAAVFQRLENHYHLYLAGCAYSGASVARCIGHSRNLSEKIVEDIVSAEKRDA